MKTDEMYNELVQLKLGVGSCRMSRDGNCAVCPPELKRFCETNAPNGEESVQQKIVRHMLRGLPVEHDDHRYIIISYNYGVWAGFRRGPAYTRVELYDERTNSVISCAPEKVVFDL